MCMPQRFLLGRRLADWLRAEVPLFQTMHQCARGAAERVRMGLLVRYDLCAGTAALVTLWLVSLPLTQDWS